MRDDRWMTDDSTTDKPLEEWVDVAAVAAHLHLTVDTVRTHAKTGQIPGVRIGKRWRFRLSDIDAYLSRPRDPWAQSNQSRGRRRKL